MTAGSALKFGLVAEGECRCLSSIRTNHGMDTAAGQVIVSEVGKHVTIVGGCEPLLYNKKDLLNPGFIVM